MANGTQLKSCIARDQILEWIRDGRLAPGHRLPAEPALARMLNMHHVTVRRGLAELQEQGVIEKRPRVGNFVKAGVALRAENQIAVVLHAWTSEQSPHYVAAGLTMAELNHVIDRGTYSLTMLTNSGSHLFERPQSAGNVILRNQIKAVLLYANDSPDHLPAIRRLLDAGVKVVLINHATTWDELGLFSVKYDEAGALRQIFARLVELGHRRIAVAFDPTWYPAFHDLYRGCVEAMFKTFDLGALEDMAVYPRWDPVACGRDSAPWEPLFDRVQRPTAVVVPDETFAAGMLRFCYRLGIRIPDDLSLAATQNYSPHAHAIAISAPRSDVLLRRGVCAAAKHLLAFLAGNRPVEREVSLRCDIDWTDSVGPVRESAASSCVAAEQSHEECPACGHAR